MSCLVLNSEHAAFVNPRSCQAAPGFTILCAPELCPPESGVTDHCHMGAWESSPGAPKEQSVLLSIKIIPVLTLRFSIDRQVIFYAPSAYSSF